MIQRTNITETTPSSVDKISITEEKIRKKLNKLKISKSPGPDAIHPRILKEMSDVLCTLLEIIFSTSQKTGTVPSEWKTANITAIYKKGDKKMAGNYRPVSLTCILCKVMESLVRDEIMAHLVKNKMLSRKQYGFISGRSTVLQLLTVLDQWMQILDEGGWVDVIYFDYMKAFDKVPHQRLLNKLKRYGIDGPLLDWVRAFLMGRKQRVNVQGDFSE